MNTSYESFPWWMVALCNAVTLGIYAIGICVLSRLGWVWGAIYAAYCVWMEWRLMTRSCRGCYYYGKRCGFGKGLVCSLFWARSVEQTQCKNQISWRDLVPDFMVSLIPLVVGVALLVWDFSWLVLLLILALVALASVGTGLIRGKIACRYCRQRELGCPAEQLFNKQKHA
jgi:hypothetical protein